MDKASFTSSRKTLARMVEIGASDDFLSRGYDFLITGVILVNLAAVVLDTFGGSGSTMMACEQMNRTCFMMELDEKYASVILRRAVENGIAPEDIFVERNGERLPYVDLVKEVQLPVKTEK